MNASAGKTLGIIAIILLILILAGPVRHFFFAPFGLARGWFNGFHVRHFDSGDYWAWPWIGLGIFFALALLVIWVFVLIWVYRDAEKRGMNGAVWVLVVLFVHLIGLLIYFIVRSDHPVKTGPAAAAPTPAAPPAAQVCPKCGKPIDKNYAYCPSCGEALKRVCPKCGREVQPGWKACPNCGQKL
jgi:RNA polymerase subunit RPABC4/transcription elongation factor Spt4